MNLHGVNAMDKTGLAETFVIFRLHVVQLPQNLMGMPMQPSVSFPIFPDACRVLLEVVAENSA